MSLTVLVIGLAHAIPIVGVGIYSGSLAAAVIAAVVMTGVAFGFGGPQWVAYDLVGVAIGLGLCWMGLPSRTKSPEPMQVQAAPPKKSSSISDGLVVVAGIGALIGFLNGKGPTSFPSQPTATPAAMPVQPPQAKPNSTESKKAKKPAKATPPATPSSPDGDLRNCLSLSSNEAIARCATDR